MSFQYSIDPSLFDNIDVFKQNYSDVINKCMNLYLITKYNLKGYSEPILCETNFHKDTDPGKLNAMYMKHADIMTIITHISFFCCIYLDYLDLTFLAVIFAIVAVTLIFTFVDRRFNPEGTLSYYKQPVDDKGQYTSYVTLFKNVYSNYLMMIIIIRLNL